MKLSLRHVTPRQGLDWIKDAVAAFVRSPLALTGMFGFFLMFALLCMLLPYLGSVLVLASIPLMGLGMMIATASAVQGEPLGPRQFLLPLKAQDARRKDLLRLCTLYAFFSALILVISDSIDGQKLDQLQNLMAQDGTGSGAAERRQEIEALLSDPRLQAGLYARFGLTALLSIPFWHAPALIWWGHQGLAQSLFSSTLAIWRTKGAFVVYILSWCAIVGIVGGGLGLLLSAAGAASWLGPLAMPLGLTVSVMFYVSLYFMFVQTFSASESNLSA